MDKETKRPVHRGPGGPSRMAPGEKAKDFKGSIKKLIAYNKPFISLVCIALILSMLSSILSIIGPDKLKDITTSLFLFFKFNI